MLKGYIDRFDEQWLAGWVFDDERPEMPIDISIFRNEKLVKTISADIFREDLERGFGHGNHSFVVPMKDILKPGRNTIKIIVARSDNWHFQNYMNNFHMDGRDAEAEQEIEAHNIKMQYSFFEDTKRDFPEYESLKGIPGWLSFEANAISAMLASLQISTGYASGVLELGVFHGRYLAALAASFRDSGVPIVGIDAFIDGKKPLSADLKDRVIDGIKASVRRIAPKAKTPHLISGFTKDISQKDLIDICPNGFSFISVDAGHDTEDAYGDLILSDSVSNNSTVVAIDDFFAPNLPGVSEAIFKYFINTKCTKLVPFAIAGGKLFMCHISSYNLYSNYMRWVLLTEKNLKFIKKTLDLREDNISRGYLPKLCGFEILPFLWE